MFNLFSMSKLIGKGLKITETGIVRSKGQITAYLASCLIYLTRADISGSLVSVSRDYVHFKVFSVKDILRKKSDKIEKVTKFEIEKKEKVETVN